MKNNRLGSFWDSVLRFLCAAFLVSAFANTAFAQDWRLEPILRVGGEYDDNATLSSRTDREVRITGLLFDARADVDYSSPRTSFFVQPRVRLRRYDDDAVQDSDDYFLRSTFRHRTNQSTFGFGVNYDRQPVRTAERLDNDLEIEDPSEIGNNDTGRTLNVGVRDRWRMSPYWDYRLSSLSTIGARFDYTDARYEDIPLLLLVDYTDARIDLNFTRSLSNVTSWGLTLSGRRYDTENLPDEVDTTALYVRGRHALSEKTQIDGRIGLEDKDQAGFDTGPEVVGHIRLIRRLDIIRLLAEYRRDVVGSGAGTLSARDSVNFNFRRRLSDRIAAGLGIRAYKDNQLEGVFAAQERTYVQLQSSMTWYLSKSFSVEVDYRYTVIDRGDLDGELANANQVLLWLSYRPNSVPDI